MPVAAALTLFLLSLATTLAAAAFFARRLDRLGVRLGLPEALVGLLTALAADAPELSSALIALGTGEREVGVGVVVGSNLFNLAAMIGLSALLAGAVTLSREALLVEGSVGLLVTLVAGALILDWIGPGIAIALMAALLIPYLLALLVGPERLAHGGHHILENVHVGEEAALRLVGSLLAAVVLVVLGSAGMVKAAVTLSDQWNVPRAFVGTIILAGLTSLPNAFTAVRLGLARRGGALVSETFNSNTINLVGGIALPALFVSLGAATGILRMELVWLVAMTLLCLALLGRSRGAGRGAGAVIVASYLAFVAVFVATGG
jgi:cation:H+ antiporter